ncbi:toxin VapC38 [Mycobacterium tuberculosis H1329]|nr:toxin VapC38 [Mycobacterium tuberculosis H1329]
MALLDVNALVALAWDSHIHHARIREWFTANATLGWARLARSPKPASCGCRRTQKYFPARSGSQTLDGSSWHYAPWEATASWLTTYRSSMTMFR